MSGEWCVVNNQQSLFSTVAITDSDSNGTGDCNFQLVATLLTTEDSRFTNSFFSFSARNFALFLD